MMDEVGGKHFAENEILSCLDNTGGANPTILSTMVGLSEAMVLKSLHYLEDRGFVKVSIGGRLWRINEEAFV